MSKPRKKLLQACNQWQPQYVCCNVDSVTRTGQQFFIKWQAKNDNNSCFFYLLLTGFDKGLLKNCSSSDLEAMCWYHLAPVAVNKSDWTTLNVKHKISSRLPIFGLPFQTLSMDSRWVCEKDLMNLWSCLLGARTYRYTHQLIEQPEVGDTAGDFFVL